MLIVLSLVIVSMFIVGCGTGQAVKAGRVAKEVPTATKCLKDYEIGAFAVNLAPSEPGVGSYSVNQKALSGNLKGGESKVLAGVKLIHVGSVIQDYAGGMRGTDFKLEKACSKDYTISAHYSLDGELADTKNLKGVFEVNGEEFSVGIGGTKVLADGTKIILENILHVAPAGGHQGLNFELICS